MLARSNNLKIKVSLCLAVIFCLKINVLIGCEFDINYEKIQVSVKITLVFTQFSTGEPRGNVVGQGSHGLKTTAITYNHNEPLKNKLTTVF
jgi:hypothetical protein